MQVLEPLIITPAGGVNWTLTADLKVQLDDGSTITVLAGFTSDGESGPEWVKGLFIKDNTYRQTAAFVHDCLYQAGLPKDYADSVYAKLLIAVGVDPDSEWDLYEAVHLFGNGAYKGDQANLAEVAAATSHLRIQV